jgi:hypothetical protein
MDNWGEIRQLINILFCGYRRKLEIADPLKMNAETYTRPGHRVPQRVINIYIFTIFQIMLSLPDHIVLAKRPCWLC